MSDQLLLHTPIPHYITYLVSLVTNMLAACRSAALLTGRMTILATLQPRKSAESRRHEAAERVIIHLVAEVVAGDAVFAVNERK
jgi:hypothetical protein